MLQCSGALKRARASPCVTLHVLELESFPKLQYKFSGCWPYRPTARDITLRSLQTERAHHSDGVCAERSSRAMTAHLRALLARLLLD